MAIKLRVAMFARVYCRLSNLARIKNEYFDGQVSVTLRDPDNFFVLFFLGLRMAINCSFLLAERFYLRYTGVLNQLQDG